MNGIYMNGKCDHKERTVRITFKTKWYQKRDIGEVCFNCYEWILKNYRELIKKVRIILW